MNTATKGIEEIIGDPHQAIADLAAFEADNRLLSNRRSELMKQYSGRWIAIFDGDIRADEPT